MCDVTVSMHGITTPAFDTIQFFLTRIKVDEE
jgi:hypothetical protein